MRTTFALTTLAGSGSPGQDRAACLPLSGGIVIGVADGAGGISGGAAATEEVTSDLRNSPPSTAEAIRTAATARPPEPALDALIELVRLPSGTLRDDLAIVICEMPSHSCCVS